MKNQTAFAHWLSQEGQLSVPMAIINHLTDIGLTTSDLGHLIVAWGKGQQKQSWTQLQGCSSVRWCISSGLAKWENKEISWLPLYNKLFEIHSKDSQLSQQPVETEKKGEFNYNRIIKWLDNRRGTLSATVKEKKVIQDFNLKFGWSTEFIISFLELCFERGQSNVWTYQNIAKRIFEAGINSIEELASFIDELDWLYHKVSEVKRCIGQYGGVTQPQKEMYLKWSNSWGFSHDIIMRAGEETIRTNTPSFKYIDAILADWLAKGVKSLADAQKVLDIRGQEADTKKSKKSINKNVEKGKYDDLFIF